MRETLKHLLAEVHACTACAEDLPLGPRPVVQMGSRARIAIVGQAPGRKVHDSGVPWQDASGDHLRAWLGIDPETFYDSRRVALVPMGFCYPGKRSGGDAPPRPECAPLWHERLFERLPADKLVLLVGQYAHSHYLRTARKRTLTETVKAFRDYLPEYFVLPHPSWRSRLWMDKNPWFAREVLPELKSAVAARLP